MSKEFKILLGNTNDYSLVDEDIFNIVKDGKWYLNKDYVSGTLGTFKGFLHRYVMNANKKDPRIDHINGDKLDNTKEIKMNRANIIKFECEVKLLTPTKIPES